MRQRIAQVPEVTRYAIDLAYAFQEFLVARYAFDRVLRFLKLFDGVLRLLHGLNRLYRGVDLFYELSDLLGWGSRQSKVFQFSYCVCEFLEFFGIRKGSRELLCDFAGSFEVFGSALGDGLR